MAKHTTSIPTFDSPYNVTAEDRGEYQRNGHIRLRSLCSEEEIQAVRPRILSAVASQNQERRPLVERDTYGRAFLQTTNLWEFDDAVRLFTLGRRFAQVAADLMGVDSVRLYHDQALFKEPGGGPTPWHQDQYYWPLDTDRTITMWMPLVPAGLEMGTMRFASGSHQLGSIRPISISDESETFFEEFIAANGYEVSEPPILQAGDATFHSGWVLHAAGGNRSSITREAMTIIYFEDGARLLEPDHADRQRDLERWHPGQQPGELAASRLNPIVFARGAVP